MWVLWIVVAAAVLIVGVILILWLLGRRLPEEHVVSRTLTLNQPVQAVWDVIADVQGHTDWVKGLTAVERLEDRDGREVWRQRMGRNAFVLETTVLRPPVRLTRTIADDSQMFTGSWEYALTPMPDGTTVVLTERGRVKHAIPRAIMEYAMGKETYLVKHLKELAARFGEAPRIN